MTIRATTNRAVALAIGLSLITMVSAYVSFKYNGEARTAFARQVEFWRLGSSLMSGMERLNTATIRYSLSGRGIYYEKFWNELLITRALYRALDGFKELASTEYEANLIGSARKHAQEQVEILKEAIASVADGKHAAARTLLISPRFDGHLNDMMQFVYALHNKVERQTSIRVERAEATAHFFNVLSLVLLILATAVLLFMIVVFFSHRVVGPLAAITTTVDKLAKSQLDVPVPYQEERTEIGDVARALAEFITERSQVEHALREARDAAQAAAAAKTSFLANMSHELRTPLNVVLGYTELIADGIYGEISPKIKEVVDRIGRNGKHLLGLINAVLDLSKIEAGQFSLTISEYVIKDVVDMVVSMAEPLAREKGLALTVAVEDDLPVAHGDEQRITQALLNLVGNAVKFTDEGKVGIRVSRVGDAFRISVSDTGPGILEMDQQLIFEKFRQADGSTTRAKGGSGLGLAISKYMVEMHGGRLWVESAPMDGATFTFTIPICAEQRADTA